MIICLKSAASDDREHQVTVQITERLPYWIDSPVTLRCRYQVQAEGHFYRLRFVVSGEVAICCQRCLKSVDYPYAHAHELAVCANDKKAEQLMADYDCVVAEEGEVDLLEILTDELLLSSPPHADTLHECIDFTWLQ